jgi:ArsR family transcriptional regulator
MRKEAMNPISILSALAEPTRLAAIQLLWDGDEHCVCEMMEKLGATQSRMSRHMAVLKAAGLVSMRRDAQWVRYRRSSDLPGEVAALVDAALTVTRRRAKEPAATPARASPPSLCERRKPAPPG